MLHLAERGGAVGARADDGDANAGAGVRRSAGTRTGATGSAPGRRGTWPGSVRRSSTRERHALARPRERDDQHGAGAGAGREQADGLVDAGVAPGAAVAAAGPHGDHAHDARHRQEELEAGPSSRGDVEVEAEVEEDEVRERSEDEVDDDEGVVAADSGCAERAEAWTGATLRAGVVRVRHLLPTRFRSASRPIGRLPARPGGA